MLSAPLVFAPLAQASTATLTSVGRLDYRAKSGERNVLTASTRELRGPGGQRAGLEITFVDVGAVITAGRGCEARDAHTVVCLAMRDCVVYLGDRDDVGATSDGCFGVYGGPGADRLRLTTSSEFVGTRADGGPGDDTLTGGAGGDELYGGPGDDRLRPRGFDIADGGHGADRLAASGAGNLDGGPGNDVVIAGTRGSVLDGGVGDDLLRGRGGNDLIYGGGGRDRLHGGGGGDLLTDGDRPGAVDADLLDGGGDGELSYATRTSPVHVDLADPSPDGERGEGDIIRGVTSVFGGRGKDELAGSQGDDELNGGAGADRLIGRRGDDRLRIEDDDLAVGGRGRDYFDQLETTRATIVCGPGPDTVGSEEGVPRGLVERAPTAGPWLSRTCEAISYVRDDPEDVLAPARIVVRPPHPISVSARGRVVFRAPCPARRAHRSGETCHERLTLTSPRPPFTIIATRRFEVARAARRIGIHLPPEAVHRVRRRALQLRARLEVPTALGTVPVTWRFNLDLATNIGP